MALQETLSKNRKGLLFDEIESSILSEEDNNILMGCLRVKLVYFGASTTDCKEPARIKMMYW